MRTRRFRIREHQDYGYIGLAPTWMSDGQSDPLMGMGVAHDILEHGSKDRVEWQGLGGAVFVRCLTGYFEERRIGNTSPVDNVGGEFWTLFQLWGGEPIPIPGRAIVRPLRDEDAEEMIQAIVEEGCKQVIQEAAYSLSEGDLAALWTKDSQRAAMIEWMRLGYRACKARWRPVPAWRVAETFKTIESAVDTFLRNGEVYEGGECLIRFDVYTSDVTIIVEEER